MAKSAIDVTEKLITLTKKKVELLEELKRSLIYEKCDYILVKHEDDLPLRFQLFHKNPKKSLIFAPKSSVDTYIKKRNINPKLIFKDYE